ncbi:hypothetical protein RHSIM_Rhsim09G0129900 [Rhododendron simsii]|uniref:Uncharacterized protein n=1 Tax=Rhododendron simsii TaxID=118357 RepID=A0A834GGM5_RHOSS|nr:hypothetical protein RHSIM_Rhsim09G0129900 [Rhododendron simsii]
MTGKAKPKKHTAKEIQAKVDAATTNRGGGKAGLLDRSGIEKGGHAKLECPLCKVTAPDIKTMQIHHDSKHPKIPFDESKLNNLHATVAAESSSKPRPGIRGSLKKYEEEGDAYLGHGGDEKPSFDRMMIGIVRDLRNQKEGKKGLSYLLFVEEEADTSVNLVMLQLF